MTKERNLQERLILIDMKKGESLTFPRDRYYHIKTKCQRLNDAHFGKSEWSYKKDRSNLTHFTVTRR